MQKYFVGKMLDEAKTNILFSSQALALFDWNFLKNWSLQILQINLWLDIWQEEFKGTHPKIRNGALVRFSFVSFLKKLLKYFKECLRNFLN